ncbi:MAG TPA: hypothetical protein VH678_27770 [Xanthobacteraceae bacterium]|jgi:hypothetical protein
MDYFITKKVAEDGQGRPELEQIAGPYRTVTQLIDALDMLLTHYSRKFAGRRYVWWIQETAAQHNLILEELPADHARW